MLSRSRHRPPFHCTLTTSLQAMHAGVIRDMEQQRIKKERQADFDMQRALEDEYRKVQRVNDGDIANSTGKTVESG